MSEHHGLDKPAPRPQILEALSDQQLLNLAQRGRHHAFAVLCARYRYALFVYCRRRVSDRGIAEDLVQETLLAAWQHLDACREWRGWIYTIARNRCATVLRDDPDRIIASSALPLDALKHQPNRGADPATIQEQRELVSQLFGASSALPPRQKQIIQRRIAGTPFRDIAGQLGITEKVARQAAYDARRRLRTCLD